MVVEIGRQKIQGENSEISPARKLRMIIGSRSESSGQRQYLTLFAIQKTLVAVGVALTKAAQLLMTKSDELQSQLDAIWESNGISQTATQSWHSGTQNKSFFNRKKPFLSKGPNPP